jgi:hypothetical protein
VADSKVPTPKYLVIFGGAGFWCFNELDESENCKVRKMQNTDDENTNMIVDDGDDYDLPDYSEWKPTFNASPATQTITITPTQEEPLVIEEEEDDDIPNYNSWDFPKSNIQQHATSPIQTKSQSQTASTSTATQPPISTSNNYDDFHLLLQNRASTISSQKKQKPKSMFDISSLLDLEDEDTDSEEEEISYEEWKKRQQSKQSKSTQNEITRGAKSVIQLFDQMKNLSEEEPQIDMLPDEHEEFLKWMFPLTNLKI